MAKWIRMTTDCLRRQPQVLSLLLFVTLVTLFGGTSRVMAAQTTAAQARLVVQHWLTTDPAPLSAAMGHQVASVTTYFGHESVPLYYVVTIRPTGYVIVSAEDRIEPIIAFIPRGVYVPSAKRTLVLMLSRDLPKRLNQLKSVPVSADTAKRSVLMQTAGAAQQKWAKLLKSTSRTLKQGIPQLSDPRVDPLTSTTWSQQSAGDEGNAACYNYFTPPLAAGNINNYPSGCVATAMAQLMYYWQYPQVGVGTTAFTVTVDGANKQMSLRGGDGNGGPYQWANMPLSPTTATVTTAQCQAIGALCADAGAAVKMQYTADGSGAYDHDAVAALASTFHFANTRLAGSDNSNTPDLSPYLPNIVNPDLDAGFPVLFGIIGSAGGHEVVCDGYGYDGGTLYHHLNMGWSGEDNAWYNLPSIYGNYADFDTITGCMYNLFPTGTGEVISGRVLDGSGAPIANALVTASTGSKMYVETSNARGIYAFAKVPSASICTLTASKTGLPTSSITVTTGTSLSSSGANVSTSSGNVWHADIRMALPAPVLTLTNACTPASGLPGTTVTYTLHYANTGNADATGITLSDVLPTQVSYVPNSATGGGLYSSTNRTVLWAMDTLAVNQSASVSFQVTVNADTALGSHISDSAAITANQFVTAITSNIASFYVGTGGQGDWWLFRHDAQHTGLSPFTGPATARQQWVFSAKDWIYSSPAIDADGVVYVASIDSNLYAINPDGTQRWAFPTGDANYSSPAIGVDGTIYFGSNDDNLYAINPDGSQKWAYHTNSSINSSPTIAPDGTIYIGSYDNSLYAINPDCTLQWAFPTGDYILSSPALAADGTIYVGSEDGYLYAINPDGRQKWAFFAGGYVESSPAVGADGTIYVGANGLYAINPDGTLQWTLDTSYPVYSSPAIGVNGVIYAASEDGYLYAINPGGTTQWVYNTYDYVTSSPAVSADGMIYIGSWDGSLYAVKPDGTKSWSFPTGSFIDSSPALGADGTLYIGTYYGLLYAITGTAVPTVTVTPVAGANGTIAPNTAQSVAIGGSVTFTATPNTGYQVDGWYLDNNPTAVQTGGTGYTLTNITVAHTVKVTFKTLSYTVTPSAGANGAITPSTAQTVVSGGNITFTAAPNTGYQVDGWYLDGSATAVQTGGTSYTLSNVTAAHTVRVTFKAITYTVTPSAGANGSITPSTVQSVALGGSVTFTATANTGYQVDGWYLDGSATPAQTGGTSYTLTNVTAVHTIKVTFKVLTYTVTPSAGANGSIAPSTTQTVNYNGNLTFTASPNTGYQVDGWYLDGGTTAAQTGGTSYTLANITAAHTVLVTFQTLSYTVTPSAGANGSITPNSAQTVAPGGSVTFSATANTGYQIEAWYLDGSTTPVQSGGTSYSLSNITTSHTIKVTFRALTCTVTPSAGTNGSVTPSTAQTVNYNGSLTFTATPNTGYQVDGWYLDGSATAIQTGGSSYTLSNITAAHTVLVTFKALLFTVTPSAGTNGNITPNSAQTVAAGSSLTFTATPNAGYTINGWYLDGSATAAQIGGTSYTLTNITASHTIYVTFLAPKAARKLPTMYLPGQGVTVTITTTPDTTMTAYAIQEMPPAGWTVSSVDNNGSYDAVNKQVKWLFFDNIARTLHYTVTPPANTASGVQTFNGVFSSNGRSSAVIGDQSIAPGTCHPADVNGDWKLSVDELTAYGAAWKTGASWTTGPNPIPVDFVTNAGSIWKNGTNYHYDGTQQAPNCWVVGQSVAKALATAPLLNAQSPLNSGVRSLSVARITGTQPVTVTISVTPISSANSYAVQETPPAGWTISNIDNSGVFDSVHKQVKWLFLDNKTRMLHYTLTPAARNASGSFPFTGILSVNGSLGAVTGATSVTR